MLSSIDGTVGDMYKTATRRHADSVIALFHPTRTDLVTVIQVCADKNNPFWVHKFSNIRVTREDIEIIEHHMYKKVRFDIEAATEIFQNPDDDTTFHAFCGRYMNSPYHGAASRRKIKYVPGDDSYMLAIDHREGRWQRRSRMSVWRKGSR
jgi:hypothetical protein